MPVIALEFKTFICQNHTLFILLKYHSDIHFQYIILSRGACHIEDKTFNLAAFWTCFKVG